jgi:hypothetical protein
MSAACTRKVASTACAAVALLLASGGVAQAAPPACTPPPPQTTLANLSLQIGADAFCSDPDGDPLTFAISTPPAHGTAQVFDSWLVYVPADGYVGDDSFEFTASDGTNTTAPVTVAITVEENQPPTCPTPLAFEVEPGTPTSYDPYFDCEDDGYIVTFELVDPPAHGTVGPYDPFVGFTYTPAAGYQGADFFTVIARDHAGEPSDPVRIDVTILGPNHAPSCVTPVTVTMPVGARRPLDPRTTCSDPDGDPVFPELIVGPSHGHFEFGATGVIEYVADAGYAGTDRITYRVRDRRGAVSNEAVIDFVIGDRPPPPASPTADRIAPTLDLARVGGQKLAAVRRRGLKLRLSSDEAGSAIVELSVTRRTARRVRIDRKATGPVVIGRVKKTLVAGDNEVTVKLSKRAQRRLASVKRVTILVRVDGLDQAGNAARAFLRVTLRR